MGLLTSLFLAPLIGAFIIIFIPKDEVKAVKLVAALSALVSLVVALYAYFAYDKAAGGLQFVENFAWTTDLGVSYFLGVDGISLPMVLLTALIGFTSIYASWGENKRPKEFFILLLILIAGVMGTFVAQDIFIFLLFYEVVVIPIYIMVIIWGSSKRVTKEYSAMKLTIYLLVGSAFLLAGMIALYVKAGASTFSIPEIAAMDFSESTQIFLFFFLLVGFGSLLSMWPFHSWSPDGYAGAPTAVSMIHAGVLKKIGGYGLIRIGLAILPLGAKFWAPYIVGLGVIGAVYASFAALKQRDLKYIVGYSSVAHMGFVLIGIAAMNVISVNGAIANMFAHGVMAALFFAMIGYVYGKTHTRNVDELGGLAHQLPKVATGFVIAGMASLGLPGLISFVPEFTIFVGAWSEAAYRPMVIFGIASIILTAMYNLRLIATSMFGPRKAQYDSVPDARGAELVPLFLLGAVIIIGGLFPSLLTDMVNSGVDTLMAKIAEVLPVGGSN
ncbi:MAG: dehydrogenase subunit [Paenibacillaceae bacterium]|jgi:NADH-quinone oxidoreductase subunit M|nr:dehydrogenase subunit [Paenibacillaceae bacterium]